ncbi:MAG: hypothetical protein QXV17_13540, partial [Candidatus Micrarchaeaceae archaeon]
MLGSLKFALMGINPMIVDRIEDDSVILNIGFKNLYGFKIVSNIERTKTASIDAVNKIINISTTNYNKVLYVIIRKERIYDTNFTSIYYLSYNKEILKVLIDSFSNLNVRVLNGYEIANILYSITSLTHSVSFDKNTGDIKEIANYFTKLDTGTISRDKYAKMIKEIDPDQYKVYVATGFIHNELYFDRIIGANWDGTLIITLNFNDMQNTIKRKKGQSMTRLKHIKEMENNLKSGEKVYVGINIHLISKDIEEDTASSVFYSLGFTPIEKRYEKDIYILSALYVRDTDYTFIVEPDQVYRFLIYYYEKTSFPEVADIVGKNRLGSFISYSFFEENNNPHCFIFAPSGAGKSFSMQNMLCNILRISPEQLLTTPVRSDIRNKIRVRYFDKGFSAELLFKLMKERGYPASAFQSNVDSITVNPCDIMNEDSTELDYSVSVVNMCLQATEMLPLT